MNIAEILKKCPKGTKLYSPIFGEVELDNVDDKKYPITCITRNVGYELFTSEGKYFLDYPDTECVLFPSKDQRDWRKFIVPDQVPDTVPDTVPDQKPKTELKPFDKVLARDDDDREWRCDFFSHLGDKEGVFICLTTWWKQCIPYEGNEHLLGTTNNPNNETEKENNRRSKSGRHTG